jgi:hypothetical protein
MQWKNESQSNLIQQFIFLDTLTRKCLYAVICIQFLLKISLHLGSHLCDKERVPVQELSTWYSWVDNITSSDYFPSKKRVPIKPNSTVHILGYTDKEMLYSTTTAMLHSSVLQQSWRDLEIEHGLIQYQNNVKSLCVISSWSRIDVVDDDDL